MKKESTEENVKGQIASWKDDLAKKQNMRPVQVAHDNLKNYEIPQLESDIKEMELEHPDIIAEAEKVGFHPNLTCISTTWRCEARRRTRGNTSGPQGDL